MAVNMQVRRGTAAAWTAANPTLLAGEIGYETDSGKFKVGDGATVWSSLSYSNPGPTGAVGPAGPMIFGPQGDEGEDGWPGVPGVAGAAGPAGVSPTYTAKTAAYTAVANDLVSCTSGTFTVTLPAAASNLNKQIWVVNNGTGTITIGRTGADTVGLATSQTLNPGATATTQGDAMVFTADGISNWNIV
jgi:hypothetical protein